MTLWVQQQRPLLLLALVLCLTTVHAAESNLHVGGAINLLSRYGYMSISMKVVPRNDTDSSWIYREPTTEVFKDLSGYTVPTVGEEAGRTRVFNGDFHMEFCDNLRQLLQAYFRDFSFENLDRPWRAFSGSWPKSALARHLGINASYVNGQYCYVLVRVSRHRQSSRMRPADADVDVDEDAIRGADAVIEGDEASVYNFVKNYGSHYVLSYTTGNALYQVFVFEPAVYARIKERLKSKGVGVLSSNELSGYFSPWYAEHIGEIQSASGNHTIQNWASKSLRSHFYFFTYPSLLKLHGDTKMLGELNSRLGNEAILAMDLRTLAPVFKNSQKRAWFLEVLDNYLKLWETNM